MYTLSHNPSANYCFGKTPPLDLILNQARNIFRKFFKVLYMDIIIPQRPEFFVVLFAFENTNMFSIKDIRE